MDTNNSGREATSAFSDGELSAQEIERALSQLREMGPQSDWETYHQIGDILRSDDMAITLSPDFSARLFAKIADEPTYIAPASVDVLPKRVPTLSARLFPDIFGRKRLLIPGIAAAAAVAYFTAPALMVASLAPQTKLASQVALQSRTAGDRVIESAASMPAASTSFSQGESVVVMRDPRIDEYLLAHQRFSPSLYSTAQFARAANFATDTDK